MNPTQRLSYLFFAGSRAIAREALPGYLHHKKISFENKPGGDRHHE
jgi:hypothetical protein